MSNKLHEQISALVDNEVDNPQLLIRQMCKDSELIDHWRRYHLMRDVINDQISTSDTDLSLRISKALEDEPELHTVIKKTTPSRLHKTLKQVAGLAIAATVSAVAVITVQQQSTSTSFTTQKIAAVEATSAPQAQAQVRFVNEPGQMNSKIRSKLSNFLVNHNEYSLSSNVQGVLPYTRVVNSMEQRVVVRSINEK